MSTGGGSRGVARILFLGGPGQKWAGIRLTNWSSPVRKSAAPNLELSGEWVSEWVSGWVSEWVGEWVGGLRGWLHVTIF